MSRQGERPGFGAKTSYDVLVVDTGESDEEVEEVPPPDIVASPTGPPKPSKSALKKAAKQARTEKRQRLKALSKARTTELVDSAGSTSPSSSPAHSVVNPVKPLPDIHDASTTTDQPVENIPVEVEFEPLPHSEDPSVPPAPPNGIHAETLHLEPTHLEASSVAPQGLPLMQATVEPVTPTSQVEEKPLIPTTQKAQVVETEQTKKRQNMLTRTVWTFIMIIGFITLLLLGHAPMILLVMLCQTLVYGEITALFSLKQATPESRESDGPPKKDPWSKTLNWYFFAVTNYFLYGESIIYYFKHVVFADAQLLPFATNHRIISFTLYTMGFMGFVMSLKKGYLKQQFSLFCWVHMTLLLIVVSSHFIINNILEGLIWFWVPASLVICNDVFAYIWGVTLGRTPLIKLSPKKTVEGFIGAFCTTVIFSVIWGTYFMRFNYMTCPVHELGVNAWSSIECTPNPAFVWKEWVLWKPLATFLSTMLAHPTTTIPYVPYQFHLLLMACFASLVAPFGGFFASGFKRAFNIKDFGHSIPGHGGMTDRMDCQFLMGVFVYVYYSSLLRVHHVTVGSVLQTIVSGLTIEQQLELIADLKKYLGRQGISIP